MSRNQKNIKHLRDELAGMRVLWSWAIACQDTESADNINKQIVDQLDLIRKLEANGEHSEPN